MFSSFGHDKREVSYGMAGDGEGDEVNHIWRHVLSGVEANVWYHGSELVACSFYHYFTGR